jgi:hypothetical protein
MPNSKTLKGVHNLIACVISFSTLIYTNTNFDTNKFQESGGMQILRQSLAKPCKQEVAQMSLMHILSMDFQDHYITALLEVSKFKCYMENCQMLHFQEMFYTLT